LGIFIRLDGLIYVGEWYLNLIYFKEIEQNTWRRDIYLKRKRNFLWSIFKGKSPWFWNFILIRFYFSGQFQPKSALRVTVGFFVLKTVLNLN
jgi:hypothetical protein